MNAHALFNGLQHVPGLGYVQGPASRAGGAGLGDEASVMMISGLGSSAAIPGVTEDKGYYDKSGNWVPKLVPVQPGGSTGTGTGLIDGRGRPQPGSAFKPAASPLQVPLTLFNVTLPLWAWLAIAAVLGGAGGYYLRGRLR